MLKRVLVQFLLFVAALPLFAQVEDDWESDDGTPVVFQSENQGESYYDDAAEESDSTAVSAAESVDSSFVGREVPVRYWIMGDSVELEAIFVKIQNDTVYLKKPNAEEQKELEKIEEENAVALQESNGQSAEEDGEEENVVAPAPVAAPPADTVAAEEPAETQAPEEDDADDDFEAALEKEDKRMKDIEIAQVEEEIRQREIQDSIAAERKNPYIKIYRLNLRRLYNMEDDEMIDLSLSNYVVPEAQDEEETIELYPPGNANLLVVSSPAACSLFVNGIPLNMTAPDTIKKIKPGKYTISVMQVLKGVEWWGSAVVRIDADSLNKVEIPVERPSTKLTLNTDPEAVEVYINTPPTVNEMPHYLTDVVIDGIRPQPQISIHFRKVGYRDTTIVTEVKSFMPNLVNVEMEPVLDDLMFIESQNEFDHERSKRRVGRGLLWGSIVPFVVGGVMWYLAEKDWSDAADKKSAYGLSAFESPDTEKMVKDNHDLNRSGDIKFGVAAGLGALGISLLTVGFVLAF